MRSAFLRQFNETWPGGYFEGNPRDPLDENTYGVWGYHSAIFTVYMSCIRPYIDSTTTVLEIGPGRGAWSKAILERGPKHLYAVDAAPAEHTKFWQYVGTGANATYIVASDFSLDGVPNECVDHFFSFGVFCHLKPEMSAAYIKALARKVRPGGNGFLHFGDFDKYNNCLANPSRFSLLRIIQRQRRKIWLPVRIAYILSWRLFRSRMDIDPVSKMKENNLTDASGRGSWYHWSTEDACGLIEACGFEVVERDMGLLARDPIVHFRKPVMVPSRSAEPPP